MAINSGSYGYNEQGTKMNINKYYLDTEKEARGEYPDCFYTDAQLGIEDVKPAKPEKALIIDDVLYSSVYNAAMATGISQKAIRTYMSTLKSSKLSEKTVRCRAMLTVTFKEVTNDLEASE